MTILTTPIGLNPEPPRLNPKPVNKGGSYSGRPVPPPFPLNRQRSQLEAVASVAQKARVFVQASMRQAVASVAQKAGIF